MVDLTDILKDMASALEEGRQIERAASRDVIDMIETVCNPEKWDDEPSEKEE